MHSQWVTTGGGAELLCVATGCMSLLSKSSTSNYVKSGGLQVIISSSLLSLTSNKG